MLPSLATELDPKDQIQFIASHRPGLLAGDYTLDVGQEVTITGTPHWFPRTGQNFSVLGERFQLPPEQIHAAFPPPGSRGDFWRDLPHVILARSTLPWERTALGGSSLSENDPPWLALIVFHGAEAPSPGETADKKPLGRGIVPLSSLLSSVSGAGSQYRWPGIELESGQHNEDQVTVIDAPWQLLKEQLPAFDYQTHCRGRLAYLDSMPSTSDKEALTGTLRAILEKQPTPVMLSPDAVVEDPQGVPGQKKWRVRDRVVREEYEIWESSSATREYDFYRVAAENAVILGGRLPMPGQRNVVHLVSLEGRYSNVATFEFQDAAPTDLIRLVSLYNWEFFCEDPTKDFKGLLENLNKDPQGSETPSTFRLPVPDAAQGQNAEQFLRAGFVPLVHRFRQGSRSVSWYHGPLVPGELGGTHTDPDTKESTPGTVTPCASAADELLIYDKDRGMFDASYAAAWELGRMLTLRNLRVATSLYHWKRDHVQSLNAARYLMDYGFELPVNAGQNASNLSWPDEVGQWLNELTLLRHVPFPYLVPDERLLPLESLRFFTLDRTWLECLRDGAYSIGRVSSADMDRDQHTKPLALQQPIPTISGFLLRSEVVAGFWPSLRVRAYANAVPAGNPILTTDKLGETDYPPLTLMRTDRLSKNVMICLYVDKPPVGDYGLGVVQMIDFFLKPEMLHFGFEENDNVPPKFDPAADGAPEHYLIKKRRDANGMETERDPVPLTSIPPDTIVVSDKRVVNIAELAKRLQPGIDASQFALNMIAGTELVRFCRR